jgi:formylglycine-generating enzyme required for sulfatase activity
MAVLPTLALAQQAGQHITRPGKAKPKTEKPAPKPSKKQTAPKPSKQQSHSQPVGTGRALSETPRSQTSVSTDAAGNKVFTVKGVQFTMIKVDGGTFTMGATNVQENNVEDGITTEHQVTLSSYYIGQTEVTQALWQAVMGSNPSSFRFETYPVENVSWDNCQEFLRKLNSLTGENFKLPTEAQWEFAARGGNKSRGYKYSGSNILDEVAWYKDNSHDKGISSMDYGTNRVSTKHSNELGLYDMSGNVCELCQDWYGDYSSEPQTNPIGPSAGSSRVSRGGCWFYPDSGCTVSHHDGIPQDLALSFIGFRLAL